MTREEQMWEAVEQKHGELSRREAFVTLTAMEWADKTMIERAGEWLESMLQSHLGYYGAADFVDTFCKAMLEEE